MMDVTVRSHGGGGSIGNAAVEIDLGDGQTLVVKVAHETDRYRRVRVQWRGAFDPTGKVVAHAKLDLRTGEQVDTSIHHPILTSDRGGRR